MVSFVKKCDVFTGPGSGKIRWLIVNQSDGVSSLGNDKSIAIYILWLWTHIFVLKYILPRFVPTTWTIL